MMDNITRIIKKAESDEEIKQRFLKRVKKGKLTRDENGKSHFCVFFPSFDKNAKKVFLGHHIVSGLWMFCGGYLDIGETPRNALKREILEEWGIKLDHDKVEKTNFLTISSIKTSGISCKTHYDIWYFINANSNNDEFKKENLKKEFFKTGWFSIKQAKSLAKHPTTLKGLDFIEKRWLS